MEELSKKDREKLRQSWVEMYEHSANDALSSPTPHAHVLAIMNKRLADLQKLENIETEVKELKEEVDKASKQVKKLDDLWRRLDRLARKG